jgi:hypothetical protein
MNYVVGYLLLGALIIVYVKMLRLERQRRARLTPAQLRQQEDVESDLGIF